MGCRMADRRLGGQRALRRVCHPLERSGTSLTQGADLGVVPVERFLAFPQLAMLLALVGSTDRAARSDIPLVGIAAIARAVAASMMPCSRAAVRS